MKKRKRKKETPKLKKEMEQLDFLGLKDYFFTKEGRFEYELYKEENGTGA